MKPVQKYYKKDMEVPTQMQNRRDESRSIVPNAPSHSIEDFLFTSKSFDFSASQIMKSQGESSRPIHPLFSVSNKQNWSNGKGNLNIFQY